MRQIIIKTSTRAVLLLLLATMGCGGGAGMTPVYKAKGKITLGGAPIADAIVVFSPKGKQPVAIGRTNSNGVYTLTTYTADDGAAAGDYIVLVTKNNPAPSAQIAHGVDATAFSGKAAHNQVTKSAPKPSGAHGASSAPAISTPTSSSTSLLPEKYGNAKLSTLTATVTAKGPNDKLDQDLKP